MYNSYPNAFAALRVLESVQPVCCLYSGLRAKFTTNTALAIPGSCAVENPNHAAAMRDPLVSIAATVANVQAIAPSIQERGVSVDPAELTLDLEHLAEFIRTVIVPNWPRGSYTCSPHQDA